MAVPALATAGLITHFGTEWQTLHWVPCINSSPDQRTLCAVPYVCPQSADEVEQLPGCHGVNNARTWIQMRVSAQKNQERRGHILIWRTDRLPIQLTDTFQEWQTSVERSDFSKETGKLNVRGNPLIFKGRHFFFPPVILFLCFYWTITALHSCVSFCCTMKRISYMETYILPLGPPSHPPPSRSSQSTELSFRCFVTGSC